MNIISFNVPCPANYGGVIDVYYRIEALAEAGVKIHLHCFEYGRKSSKKLESICEKVFYYHRSKSWLNHFSYLPFIVKTRNNKQLFDNLLQNDYPILFEGIHCCFYLPNKLLKKRLKIVRSHNIEHDYYSFLAAKTKSFTKRAYYWLEAQKLKNYEKVYSYANYVAAISKSDFEYLSKKFGDKVFILMPSHTNSNVSIKQGKGSYLLYHGNLSVSENNEAAMYVVNRIAPHISFPFVIAGNNPSGELICAVNQCFNVKLVANPTEREMDKLLKNAHINFLPTFQPTGFKLKLLNALFNGRFCVGNSALTWGTGLDDLCSLADNDKSLIKLLNDIVDKDFDEANIEKRKALLKNYSNSAAVLPLLNML